MAFNVLKINEENKILFECTFLSPSTSLGLSHSRGRLGALSVEDTPLEISLQAEEPVSLHGVSSTASDSGQASSEKSHLSQTATVLGLCPCWKEPGRWLLIRGRAIRRDGGHLFGLYNENLLN